MSKEEEIKAKMKGKGKKTPYEDLMDDDSNINNDSKSKSSILDDINKEKSRSQTHTFKGFYLENEVAAAFDRLTSGSKKGVKSELVNRVLKKFLQEEGVL